MKNEMLWKTVKLGKKTEMLYLSSSLPALSSISSIFRSNKTVLPPSILPALQDTLADKLARRPPPSPECRNTPSLGQPALTRGHTDAGLHTVAAIR